MSDNDLAAIDLKVQDLLVEMWNDLSNRQAGEILFERHQDILSVHTQIMDIVKGYKTVERVIDEFYQYCTDNQLTPTLIRFEKYIKARKYPNQSNKEKSL